MTVPEPSVIRSIVDEMIGKPFQVGGQGPDAYYCLGLAIAILNRAVGAGLMDPFRPGFRPHDLNGFKEKFVVLDEKDSVQPLDLLYSTNRDGGNSHVVVVESDRWAVSVDEFSGVAREELAGELEVAESVHRLRILA